MATATAPAAPTYLLVETHGPQAGPGCAAFVRDALLLARAGHRVRLCLIQGGVTAAVPGAVPDLAALTEAGGQVWVDRFSVAQRGLVSADLLPAARGVDMDEIACDVLDAEVTVVWR